MLLTRQGSKALVIEFQWLLHNVQYVAQRNKVAVYIPAEHSFHNIHLYTV